jgi:hypothetical protein
MASQDDLKLELQKLTIGELRSKAANIYDIKLSREHTKEDIIGLIATKAKSGVFFDEATSDRPAPGWARIKIHPVPGKPSITAFVAVNGQPYWIPQNVPVDVPIKLIGVLTDAVEMIVKQNPATLEEVRTYESSYPFTVIDRVEGPDPRPGWEVIREKMLADHRAFAAEKGYWPNRAALEKWRERGSLRDAMSA